MRLSANFGAFGVPILASRVVKNKVIRLQLRNKVTDGQH